MEFPVYVPHFQIWGIYLSFHLSLGIEISSRSMAIPRVETSGFLNLPRTSWRIRTPLVVGQSFLGGLVELGAQRMGKKQLEKRVPTGYSCNEFKLLDIDSFPGNINYTPIPAKLITVCHSCPLKEGTVLFYDFFHLSGDMFFLPAG